MTVSMHTGEQAVQCGLVVLVKCKCAVVCAWQGDRLACMLSFLALFLQACVHAVDVEMHDNNVMR
jgi:hypothetical protein